MRNIFILLALLCASCGTALPTIKPYKLDVQQGNVVTSKMLLQLRPGMTKSQVRFIMGTPLIQDSFHGNRWDYVYQMREGGKIKEQRRVILDFENELLKSVRGDVIPAGSEASKVNEPEAPIGTRVVTPIKKPEEKGFMDKLKFWQKDDAELAKEAAEKQSAEKQAAENQAAAKAKLEADQAAKKAAADEAAINKAADIKTPGNTTPDHISTVPQVGENAAPAAADSKSLLAVPIEAAPLETPAAATQTVIPEAQVSQPAAATKEVVRSAAPVSESVRESAPVKAAPALPAPVEPAAEIKPAKAVPVQAAPAQAPAKAPSYQSESGMQFDRQLQFEVEQEEPAPLPAGPRTGNKVAPKPKELPQESDPSFFDRMLEKIGF